MNSRFFLAAVIVVGLGCSLVCAQSQPTTFFKGRIALSDAEIQQIEQGQVLTKVLDTGDKYGLLVFGAVYINAPIPKFATAYRDINTLLRDKVYVAVQEFSQVGSPPKLSDFAQVPEGLGQHGSRGFGHPGRPVVGWNDDADQSHSIWKGIKNSGKFKAFARGPGIAILKKADASEEWSSNVKATQASPLQGPPHSVPRIRKSWRKANNLSSEGFV